MDKIKKARRVTRTAFTRILNSISTTLLTQNPDKDVMEAQLKSLEKYATELTVNDDRLVEAMLDSETISEEDVDLDKVISEEYQNQFTTLARRVQRVISPKDDDELSRGSTPSINNTRKFKLPKIELEKFSGDLKEWLGFWSQFKKIDEDGDIAPADKFQYLLQATVEGSRARDLVKGFPPSADNHCKVIECFKKRFGREDLLVEVYVRELSTLVLNNVQHKEKIVLVGLFDTLESHMRALDSLGVTSTKCAAMLYPLVESCLPEDLLRAWQRSLTPIVQGADEARGRLDQLMLFLQLEVEREERIALAVSGFSLDKKQSKKNSKSSASREAVPTAMGLLTSSTTNKNTNKCVFCDLNNHLSTDCFRAQKMSLVDKRKVLWEKICCSRLKVGHFWKSCKVKVDCNICGLKNHYDVMCFNESGVMSPNLVPAVANEATVTQQALSNCTASTNVLLQTLIVKIKHNNRTRAVRVIIDTGSQRSYIVKSLAEEMGYSSQGVERSQQLFGGTTSKAENHNIYPVSLKAYDGKYECMINMLEQPFICGEVPKVKSGPWLQELKQRNVFLSDEQIEEPLKYSLEQT